MGGGIEPWHDAMQEEAWQDYHVAKRERLNKVADALATLSVDPGTLDDFLHRYDLVVESLEKLDDIRLREWEWSDFRRIREFIQNMGIPPAPKRPV